MSLRILTQVNFSSSGNPEGDSGLYFISSLIHSILEKDEGFHFYVLIPSKHKDVWGKRLTHARITLLPIDIASRSHGGNFHFNPNQLFEIFKFREYEVDCLFINQPESTNAYLHFFNKLLFHKIPAVSYIHWFDTRDGRSKSNNQEPVLMSAINGMISSNIVGCNSEYGKKLILEQSEKWYNETCINQLKSKIKILPPGIDTKELDRNFIAIKKTRKKKIIINHRLLKYTGVRDLLTQTFPKLWEIRKDFEVIVTNPSNVRLPLKLTNVPWLTDGKFGREEYIRQLWSSDIVVCPHKSTHWSISTLEAIYTQCVPLMNSNSFFPELMTPVLERLDLDVNNHIKTNWFYSNNSLVSKICFLLDNIEKEKNILKDLSQYVKEIYDWNTISDEWIKVFHEVDSKTHIISETNPSYKKILNLIQRDGGISKQEILRELAWGPQSSTLSWTAFRQRLKNIAFDDSNNSEVFYQICENEIE